MSSRHVFIAVGVFLAFLAVIVLVLAAYIIGGIVGQEQLYLRETERERALLEPVVSGDERFVDIEVERRSDGGVGLRGTVSTHEAETELRSQLVLAVGESRADELMTGVRQANRDDDAEKTPN